MGNLIDGSLLSQKIKEQLHDIVEKQVSAGHRKPKLAVIMVGEDPRSAAYVRNKEKSCAQVGIECTLLKYPLGVSAEELVAKVEEINGDPDYDGQIVQLPLPGFDEETTGRITSRILINKDVDGLEGGNVFRLYNNDPGALVSATPLGILKLIESTGCNIDGKNAVIIGRGKLVGRPLALLLTNKNATVTLCHTHTTGLKEICQKADILITAIGKAKVINSEYVREGAIVIDAGINVTEEGKLVGDCDYQEMLEKVSWITPVPRGVGPMTVAMLMHNVVQSYLANIGEEGL